MNLSGFIQVPIAQTASLNIKSSLQNTAGAGELIKALPEDVSAITQETTAKKTKQKNVRAKNGFGRSLTALIAGGFIDIFLTSSISNLRVRKLSNIAEKTTLEERQNLSKAADYALKASNASSAGARILRVDPNNQQTFNTAARLMKEVIDKSSMRFIPEKSRYFMNCSVSYGAVDAVRKGFGTVPLFSKNTIIAPSGKFDYSSLQYLGRLINQNTIGGKILKYAGKIGTFALPAVILLSLCSRNKYEEDGKKLGGWEKFTNGIRQNAGKLSLLCIAPEFINNIWGLATSGKFTTEYLKQNGANDIIKKISEIKNVNIAVSALSTAITIGAVYTSVKIKDSLQHRKDKQLLRKLSSKQEI